MTEQTLLVAVAMVSARDLRPHFLHVLAGGKYLGRGRVKGRQAVGTKGPGVVSVVEGVVVLIIQVPQHVLCVLAAGGAE